MNKLYSYIGSFLVIALFLLPNIPFAADEKDLLNLITNKDKESSENAGDKKGSKIVLENISDVLSWKNSIMFSEKELSELYDALNKYDPEVAAKKPEVKSTVNLPSGSEIAPTETPPVFYLQSIIFYSPQDWILWLNGKKIRTGENYSPSLSVVKVDEDKAYLLWKSPTIDDLIPGWENSLKENASNAAFLPDSDLTWTHHTVEGNILVNKSEKVFGFILRPNQSLITGEMAVLEGHPKEAAQLADGTTNSNELNAFLPPQGQASSVQGESGDLSIDNLMEEIFGNNK